jgi:hypothetical protein
MSTYSCSIPVEYYTLTNEKKSIAFERYFLNQYRKYYDSGKLKTFTYTVLYATLVLLNAMEAGPSTKHNFHETKIYTLGL